MAYGVYICIYKYDIEYIVYSMYYTVYGSFEQSGALTHIPNSRSLITRTPTKRIPNSRNSVLCQAKSPFRLGGCSLQQSKSSFSYQAPSQELLDSFQGSKRYRPTPYQSLYPSRNPGRNFWGSAHSCRL